MDIKALQKEIQQIHSHDRSHRIEIEKYPGLEDVCSEMNELADSCQLTNLMPVLNTEEGQNNEVEFYASVIANLPEGIIVCNANGKILLYNLQINALLNLESGTTYYVRAYAIALDENYYGNQANFTTLSPTSPAVTIESVGEVKIDSVEVSSDVTDDGGSAVTSRGVCWSLEQNPTVSDAITTDGSGTGSFNSLITGLLPDTVYYIRAYATSSVATS